MRLLDMAKKRDTRLTMRVRLFVLLLCLFILIGISVFSVFSATGFLHAFNSNYNEALSHELDTFSNDASNQYGKFSSHAVELSRSISSRIEQFMHKSNLMPSDIKDHPELLTDLILEEYDTLLFSLQRCESSGVFLILDATVNPNLPDASTSKSGLYLRNMEPNIINSLAPNILLLRGSSNIGRNYSIPLDSQWTMEFDVSDAPYYTLPIEAANERNLELSRLYYWAPALILPETYDKVMLCSVPLIDSEGNVFGVCGFEISEMLFKLSNLPNSSTYHRIFSVIAPYNDKMIYGTKGFYTGGYLTKKITDQNKQLKVLHNKKSIITYQQEDGRTFYGKQSDIKLYPDNSAFIDQRWVTSVLIPKKDIIQETRAAWIKLCFIVVVFLLLSILISFYASKQYISPLSRGIDLIKSNNFDETTKTNILEIDDLIVFLSTKQEEPIKKTEIPPESHFSSKEDVNVKPETILPASLFDVFVSNTKLLSPAERAVFNLYLEGYTAKDITQLLSLSINTIKTHNKRIYMKLNVSSRNELLLYVNMLKETGTNLTT